MTKHWVHKYNLVVLEPSMNSSQELKKLVPSYTKGNYVFFTKEDRVEHKNNFCASLLLEPHFVLSNSGQIALLSLLAMADALKEIFSLQQGLSFEWPNTLKLNNKKLASITLEASGTPAKNIPDWFMLNFSLNTVHNSKDSVSNTCLKEEGVGDVPHDTILDALISHFIKRYNMWNNRGFHSMKMEWLGYAFALGKHLNLNFKGVSYEGVFEAVDDEGAMLLRLNEGTLKRITPSEVFFTI